MDNDQIIVILLLFLAFCVFMIFKSIKWQKEAREQEEHRCKIATQNAEAIKEESTSAVFTYDKEKYIALYEDEQVVKIANVSTFKFEELLSVELRVDDDIITKKSNANMVGRAIVGGVLTGGVGAIIGGVTGKSTQERHIERIDIVIGLSNMNNPVITYNCYIFNKNAIKSIEETNVKQALDYAKQATDLLSVVIDKVERGNNNKFDLSTELLKMKGLLDQGILSQEEYDKIKKRLLNQ